MRKCMMDIWAGVGFLALAAAFGVQLGDLSGVSRLFPQSLAIFVALGGAYFILKGGVALLRERAAAHKAAQDAEESGDAEVVVWPRVGLISVMAVGYALVVKTLGFFASTSLFLFVAFMLLGDRSLALPKRVLFGLVFAAGFCFFIWAGFVKLLNVPTPVGILP